MLERVEVAGPGFLNLFLADCLVPARAGDGARAGGEFGAGVVPAGERERVLVEFVSANPTGPLNAAGGRHAAFGDSLARVLEFAGPRDRARVLRERLRHPGGAVRASIAARMTGEPVPEDGYQGEYVTELADARAEGLDPD